MKNVFLNIPISLVGKSPYVIATYVSLAARSSIDNQRCWDFKDIYTQSGLDDRATRINMLTLRVMGFLRFKTQIPLLELIEDMPTVSIELIDQALSYRQLKFFDPLFDDFLNDICKLSDEVYQWLISVDGNENDKDIIYQRQSAFDNLLKCTQELRASLGNRDLTISKF